MEMIDDFIWTDPEELEAIDALKRAELEKHFMESISNISRQIFIHKILSSREENGFFAHLNQKVFPRLNRKERRAIAKQIRRKT